MPFGCFGLEQFGISDVLDLFNVALAVSNLYCLLLVVVLYNILVSDVFQVNDATTKVVSIIFANQLPVNIIDVKYKWRQFFTLRVVYLQFQKLVKHGIKVVFDAFRLSHLLLHALFVAVLVNSIVDYDKGVTCTIIIGSWQVLALE